MLRDIERLSQRLRTRPLPYTLEGRRRLLDDTAPASIVYALAGTAPAGSVGGAGRRCRVLSYGAGGVSGS